jgi:hypothetical protein
MTEQLVLIVASLVGTAALGFTSWAAITLHSLVAEVRAIRAALEAGREVHERHERQIEQHADKLRDHGERIASLEERDR